jgi:hypothetical protein
VPAALAWKVGRDVTLEVEYDRWVALGSTQVPGRVRAASPDARFRAEVQLDRVEPRESFADSDFQIDGNP